MSRYTDTIIVVLFKIRKQKTKKRYYKIEGPDAMISPSPGTIIK